MKKLWTLIFLGFAANILFAQEVKVKIDTNAILIGQQIQLSLDYQLPSDLKAYFPLVPDSLGPNLEVVERSKIDTTQKDGMTRYFQELKVTAFDSGYVVLPAFEFAYKKKEDTAISRIVSDPHLISVFNVEADTTKPIKPLAGPMEEPYTLMEFLPWIGLGLAIIALIFVLFYFYRKRKKRPLFKKEGPKIPAHERALDDFARLRLKKLWQAGKVKAYFSELTDVLRIYIEERFEVAAVEMTTSEILQGLEKQAINEEAMHKLRQSLELADLVKFAKVQPSPLENDSALNDGIDFVNETKAVEIKREEESDVQ